MSLSKTEFSAIQKAMSVGNSDMAIPISENIGRILLANVIRDLKIKYNGKLPLKKAPKIFDDVAFEVNFAKDVNLFDEFNSLVEINRDIVTYFVCLCSLVKARLKYKKILQAQPIPTAEQIGPRALINYGDFSSSALSSFLLWRKWIFDIDNRAAQETGYLFEPIIANAIGGVPAGSRNSPIRRHSDTNKGRQVDCIAGKLAYEIKMRVTIAASGQGRWQEELDFPNDCKNSGYKPVLVVFDSTTNPKLTELINSFKAAGGMSFVGDKAWEHLESKAGKTMAIFIEKYIRKPINETLENLSDDLIAPMTLEMYGNQLTISVGDSSMSITRSKELFDEEERRIPEDLD